MKQEYETVKEFAKDYRLEIVPMMKSEGFGVSISTSKGSYWNDGRMNFQIKKVPSNFYVWTHEYNRYSKTEKSQKLLKVIRDRVNAIILDFEPGEKVINPDNIEWGIGQVQSIINEKITVNFENVGKKVINSNNIKLERFNK